MDLKALIAKMDQIDSNTILNEGFPTVADAKARADKEKTTGKFDKKELSTGTQYTRKSSTFDDGGKDSDTKKAEKKKKNEDIEFNSSIARGLVEEFGYEVEEDAVDERITINPDGTTSGGIAPTPVAAADEFKFTPEQEKWLGGADRQDPNIIARMPGDKPPVSYFKDPADQAIAKQLNFGQQNLNTLKTAFGAKPGDAQTFADPGAAAPTADQGAATKPAAEEPAAEEPAAPTIDPAKLKRFQELLAKAGAAAPKTESVNYEDDRVLLAIKNIQY